MEKELELLTTSLHEFPQPRTTDTSIRSAKCAHDAKDRAGSMRRTTARVYRMPNSAFRRLGNIFKDPAPIHAEIYSVLRGTAITTLVFNPFIFGRSFERFFYREGDHRFIIAAGTFHSCGDFMEARKF